MKEEFVTCPNCGQAISIDDKNLLKHLAHAMASKGGTNRNKIGKAELSRIGKLGAMKRWGKS